MVGLSCGQYAVCIPMCMYVQYMYMYTKVHMYMYMYVCMYVHMYMYVVFLLYSQHCIFQCIALFFFINICVGVLFCYM